MDRPTRLSIAHELVERVRDDDLVGTARFLRFHHEGPDRDASTELARLICATVFDGAPERWDAQSHGRCTVIHAEWPSGAAALVTVAQRRDGERGPEVMLLGRAGAAYHEGDAAPDPGRLRGDRP